MTSLPTQPSRLLKVALNDLIAVENTPGYVINMGDWHYPRQDGCCVCLAGAVMVRKLDADISTEVGPDDFPDSKDQLFALDNARTGDWHSFMFDLGFGTPPDELLEELPSTCPYNHDPDQFKTDIREAITILQKHGY